MAPPSAIDVDPQGVTDTEAATIVSRLSVNGVQARRSKAPKLASGVAPQATSEMFKGPVWWSSLLQTLVPLV